MGRPRTHPHPEIGTGYGDVTVVGELFEAPGGARKGKPYKTWFVPCLCGRCGGRFTCMWNNLRRGLVQQCNDCKRAQDVKRLVTDAKVLADMRRKDEYRWYDGAPYVYAVSYEELHVLKIGYGGRHPSGTCSSANQRCSRYVGREVTGRLFWYGVPGTFADEVMLQALFAKRYGTAFAPANRLSEWVMYDTEEKALSLLRAAFKFSQENFPG